MVAERSLASKFFLVLLVSLVAIFLIGAVADAHRVPGCENETPLAKNPHCAEGHGGENPGECSDGLDNDGDGLIDGDDPDCPQPPPECSDDLDNDGDGATDEFDRDCSGPTDDTESGSDEPECSDGVDNDGDTKTDFGEGGDPDCTSDDDNSESSDPPGECEDGIDNDGDGAIDEFDRDCTGPDDDESGSQEPECSDGIDNDGDTKTDFGEGGDPDCESDDDDSEEPGTTPPQCADGIDNDGDGLTDGDDPGCDDENDNDETDAPPQPSCGDPDGDGVDHSAFDNDSNEGGPISSIVHEVDQAIPSPLAGDQGVVTEVNCAIVVTVEELLGING